MVVIPHQLEGGQTAQVELEDGKKAARIAASIEGEVPGVSGRPVEEMIKGCLLTFLSGLSRHHSLSCLPTGSLRGPIL
jgi:hypothetical protein